DRPRLAHYAFPLKFVFLAHCIRFRLSSASCTDAQCRPGAEIQKPLRTRWLSRPGLAVTDRKEPTRESVSRIRRLPSGRGSGETDSRSGTKITAIWKS